MVLHPDRGTGFACISDQVAQPLDFNDQFVNVTLAIAERMLPTNYV
jgi:hypothetical protein